MNKRNIAAVLGLCAVLVLLPAMTCAPSAQTTTYNTLSSVHVTTTGIYNGYLDLVVQGKVSTNMVPVITRDYSLFQAVWNGAVSVAASGAQSPATQPVTDAAAKVAADVATAKGTP